MRILLLGINYAPEPVGIGPYSAEMAIALADAGHEVEVVTAKPSYPSWKRHPDHRARGWRRTQEDGVRVVRCPIYLPAQPTGLRRIVHYLSFVASAAMPLISAIRNRRPDLVMTIAPSVLSTLPAKLLARLIGATSWLHIQDFEVGAAFATGLLDANARTGRLALGVERVAMRGFDRYSSISPQMCRRLVGMGMAQDRVFELRNWSDIDAVRPLTGRSPYADAWGITTPHVALYSGNIARKQGIGLVLDAARALRHRDDLTFVVCGDGAQRDALVAEAADLPNIRFHPLQPREKLHDLLGLATIHLLPQLAGAADLVLPSKLTNMLASGRPVAATADTGTGLAEEVSGCGVISPPGDAAAFAAAIAALLDDPARREALGRAARARAEQRWSKRAILAGLERELVAAAPARAKSLVRAAG